MYKELKHMSKSICSHFLFVNFLPAPEKEVFNISRLLSLQNYNIKGTCFHMLNHISYSSCMFAPHLHKIVIQFLLTVLLLFLCSQG